MHALFRRWTVTRGLTLGAEALFMALALYGVANGARQFSTNIAPVSAVALDHSAPAAGSPFAPWAGVEAAPAHTDALLNTIRAVGVRVAADPTKSGAVLTLPDQRQRAFGIGDEVVLGARLAAVHPDHVLVEREGRLLRVELSGWPS